MSEALFYSRPSEMGFEPNDPLLVAINAAIEKDKRDKELEKAEVDRNSKANRIEEFLAPMIRVVEVLNPDLSEPDQERLALSIAAILETLASQIRKNNDA